MDDHLLNQAAKYMAVGEMLTVTVFCCDENMKVALLASATEDRKEVVAIPWSFVISNMHTSDYLSWLNMLNIPFITTFRSMLCSTCPYYAVHVHIMQYMSIL